MNRAEWHWMCRWFGHKYKQSLGFDLVQRFTTCRRCGFQPGDDE